MMILFYMLWLKVLKSRHKSLSLKTSKRFEHWKTFVQSCNIRALGNFIGIFDFVLTHLPDSS